MPKTNPTAHMRNVQELLAELEELKVKGASARERLNLIRDRDITTTEDFEVNKAFDSETQAMSKRLGYLEEMWSNLRQGAAQWRGGPIPKDVKEAAGLLFGYLDQFLKDAFEQEKETEIRLLSSLWITEPDVHEVLTGRDKSHHGNPTRTLAEKKAELYAEVVKEIVEEDPGMALDALMEDPEQEIVKDPKDPVRERLEVELNQRFEDYNADLEESWKAKEAPKKYPLIVSESDPKQDVRVVGTVSEPEGLSAERPVVDEGPNHLRREAWTSVLREMTTDDWSFLQEEETTSPSTVLLWQAPQSEARLELTDVGAHHRLVNLRILLRGKLYQHVEALLDHDVIALHLSPLPFVKKTLEST